MASLSSRERSRRSNCRRRRGPGRRRGGRRRLPEGGRRRLLEGRRWRRRRCLLQRRRDEHLLGSGGAYPEEATRRRLGSGRRRRRRKIGLRAAAECATEKPAAAGLGCDWRGRRRLERTGLGGWSLHERRRRWRRGLSLGRGRWRERERGHAERGRGCWSLDSQLRKGRGLGGRRRREQISERVGAEQLSHVRLLSSRRRPWRRRRRGLENGRRALEHLFGGAQAQAEGLPRGTLEDRRLWRRRAPEHGF
mmetsp:Transcript_23557/g.59717  ORF Transcript_23557/g.59717 Transcript_23557/m.59717 type:complete len:250 (+) Transcript_23557:2356-3105(+)